MHELITKDVNGNLVKTQVLSPVEAVYNKRDVITSSGNYTAPVTGWYKVTVKGGGGGGHQGQIINGWSFGGRSGGEGGLSGGYYKLAYGTIIPCVIGAGGNGQSSTEVMHAGGDSSVTIAGSIITGNGGAAVIENSNTAGNGNLKNGDRPMYGECEMNLSVHGGSGTGGGGYGGYAISAIVSDYKGKDALPNTGAGGGGGGARAGNGIFGYGGNGGSGYVMFEYFDPSI